MKLPISKELTVPMVYLKRGRLPRIIPAHHPEILRRYDSNADKSGEALFIVLFVGEEKKALSRALEKRKTKTKKGPLRPSTEVA